jgi:hypothetical protein
MVLGSFFRNVFDTMEGRGCSVAPVYEVESSKKLTPQDALDLLEHPASTATTDDRAISPYHDTFSFSSPLATIYSAPKVL